MEISQRLYKQTNKFSNTLLERIAIDLNTLTAAPIILTRSEISIEKGNDSEFLDELYDKDRCFAWIEEDTSFGGHIHVVIDVASSIALTGLMMMMGDAVTQNQIKTREFNEEIAEGFNEVSNQITGCIADILKKRNSAAHLFLETTQRHTMEEQSPTVTGDDYLKIKAGLTVSGFDEEAFFILISPKMVKVLFEANIGEETKTKKELLSPSVVKTFHIEETDLPPVPNPPIRRRCGDPALEAMSICLTALNSLPTDKDRHGVMQYLNYRMK